MQEKKMVHTEKEAQDTDLKRLPRRAFLFYFWIVIGLALISEVVWLVTSFLKPRKKPAATGEFGALMEAGTVDVFLPGTVTAFPRGRFYLARLESGGFLALSRQCPHLGCTVPWAEEEKQFICPCHSSVFDIRGDIVRSPAPRALDQFRVTIQNDMVFVDTGHVLRRNRFEEDQVVYPEKS